MVFKVDNENGRLYKINLSKDVNEDRFVQLQTTKRTKFIKINKSDLPKIKSGVNYHEIKYKLGKDGKPIIDYDATKQSYESYMKMSLPHKIDGLIEMKRENIYYYIEDKKLSDKQIEAYKFKYKIAKRYLNDKNDNDKNKLKIEATARRISIDKFAKIIVEKYEFWEDRIEYYNQLIEMFRYKIYKLFDKKEYSKVKNIIDNAMQLNNDVTYEDVANLFK